MSIQYYISIILIALTNLSIGQSSNLGTVCAESEEVYRVNGFDNSVFSWFINNNGGIIVDGQNEDTATIRWGYNTGTFTITVYETTTPGNCTDQTSVEVTVQAPQVDLGYDFYEICDRDSVIFDASGNYDGNYSVQWHDSSYNPTYTAKRSELVWVKVTDGKGCIRFDSLEFTVHSLPELYIGNDTVLCDVENPLEITAENRMGNIANYEWYSAAQNGLVSVSPSYFVGPGHDTIVLEITDFNGCIDRDSILIFACEIQEMFRDMRNTFTPNGDGANDIWQITDFMYLFPDAVLEIFDRWGRLVYRTESVFEEPWDGSSNGRAMPMDAYFFVLELNYMNLEAMSGTVNLIR